MNKEYSVNLYYKKQYTDNSMDIMATIYLWQTTGHSTKYYFVWICHN